jgi:arginine/lysine/ornithine decarboxylase
VKSRVETYNYFYLEDNDQDFNKVEKLKKVIRNAFDDFIDDIVELKRLLKKEFNIKIIERKSSVELELIRVEKPIELPKKLLSDDNLCTDASKNILFFLLDYFIKDQQTGKEQTIDNMKIGEVPVYIWLETYFPHIPKIVFTSLPREEVTLPKNYFYCHKNELDEPNRFLLTLKKYFFDWWSPLFWKELVNYITSTGSISFHTPGHSSGNAFSNSTLLSSVYDIYSHFSFRSDLSVSVDELGDLSEPDDEDKPMTKARKRASSVFGSEDTYFITNGTSTSNKAMLMTLMEPGDVIIVDRNCHKSVHQAIVMSGAMPYYINPLYNDYLGIWLPLSKKQWRIEQSIINNLKPKMMILTSCTYEGIYYPIHEIAKYCEENNILLYADEAWAPYNRFHPHYTNKINNYIIRYNSIDGRTDFNFEGDIYGRGAHFSVQSTHKALAAFSQASMIHISRRFRALIESKEEGWDWLRERFESYEDFKHQLMETLRYWHSTSPNYPMIATLDLASTQMRLEGIKLIDERIRWAIELKRILMEKVGNCVLELQDILYNNEGYEKYLKDELKFIIGIDQSSENNERFLKNLLLKHNPPIRWEKDTNGLVLFLITIGTMKNHIESLKDVLLKAKGFLNRPNYESLISEKKLTEKKILRNVLSGDVKILPRDAVQAKGEMVGLEKSIGRISAQMVVPYPPGIPIILPGLEINEDMIKTVKETVDKKGVSAVHGLQKFENDFRIKVTRQS